jgi:DNA invertase Pin-like site-specific DNA recombinase
MIQLLGMAGLNIDINGSSASAVLATLRIRKGEIERELSEINRGISQLEATTQGAPSEPIDANYTVAERAIRKHLIATIPWGATAAEIMEETGVSRATVYRLLNAMKEKREVLQAPNGNWLLVTNYIPEGG